MGETIAALEKTVDSLDTEIAVLETDIAALEASAASTTRRTALRNVRRTRDRLRSKRFQKHRRLCALRQQHKNLTNDPAAHRVFGSRKLLQQRSRLAAPDSPVADVSEWRTAWTTARNAEVWFVGDATQSFGNQSAQIDLSSETLTIRLTEHQANRRLQAEADRLGIPVKRVKNRLSFKRLTFTGVTWSGRPSQDLNNAQALGLPITVSIQRKLTPEGKRRRQKGLTLRPKKDWGWYAQASFDLPPTPVAHSRHQGVLGVDVNAWGLSWAIATPDGNVMKDPTTGRALKGNIALPFTKDTTSDQREALCRQAVVELTDLAQLHRVAIGAESLDFQTKRAGAREGGARTARMITQLRTNGFAESLTSRCRRQGIALHWVNPSRPLPRLIRATTIFPEDDVPGAAPPSSEGIQQGRRGQVLQERSADVRWRCASTNRAPRSYVMDEVLKQERHHGPTNATATAYPHHCLETPGERRLLTEICRRAG